MAARQLILLAALCLLGTAAASRDLLDSSKFKPVKGRAAKGKPMKAKPNKPRPTKPRPTKSPFKGFLVRSGPTCPRRFPCAVPSLLPNYLSACQKGINVDDMWLGLSPDAESRCIESATYLCTWWLPKCR